MYAHRTNLGHICVAAAVVAHSEDVPPSKLDNCRTPRRRANYPRGDHTAARVMDAFDRASSSWQTFGRMGDALGGIQDIQKPGCEQRLSASTGVCAGSRRMIQ